jgi:hypothetical protein
MIKIQEKSRRRLEGRYVILEAVIINSNNKPNRARETDASFIRRMGIDAEK